MDDVKEIGRAPRRAPKASVTLAVDLVNQIVDEGLAEGTMLAHEKEMANQLGLGRATIREALRLLESRGVVRLRSGPGGGPVVRRPRPADYSGALELALKFERATLSDVIRAREEIGPLTAKLAAQRVTDDQLLELERAVATLDELLDDYDAFNAAARRFEGLIGEASGSIVVRLMVDSLLAILWDGIPDLEYPRERRESISRSLKKILASIEAGDAAAAETQMHQYVRGGAQYWGKFYPDLMRRPVQWRG